MTELEQYVAARGPAFLRTAYMLCGDRYLAEDIVQEVLARVHRRRPHIEHLDAYLRAAVVRQFLSWRRRRTGNEPPIPPGHEPGRGRGRDQGQLTRARWSPVRPCSAHGRPGARGHSTHSSEATAR
jgi:DNA-directed RNA polymerase specialized sigma24 family protein